MFIIIISGGFITATYLTKSRGTLVKDFIVVNLLNGMVTVVVAKSVLDAVKQGQKYFTEPNRRKVSVQVLN